MERPQWRLLQDIVPNSFLEIVNNYSVDQRKQNLTFCLLVNRMCQVFSEALLVGNDDEDGHVETVVNNLPVAEHCLPCPHVQYPGEVPEGLGNLHDLLPVPGIARFLEPAQHNVMQDVIMSRPDTGASRKSQECKDT